MSNQSVPFQSLEGVIERLTYHNEDNGYTVAKFTPKTKSYQVTVIGSMRRHACMARHQCR